MLETVEEVGPAQPGRRAEIEHDLAPFAARDQSGGLLGSAYVASQGHLGCPGGHVADGIADRQLVDHPADRLRPTTGRGTAEAASRTSASPLRGRPRMTARASASRDAAIR